MARRRTWGLDTEIDGVLREADALGGEKFHLTGYPGGGSAALAFAAKHPKRLLWASDPLSTCPLQRSLTRSGFLGG